MRHFPSSSSWKTPYSYHRQFFIALLVLLLSQLFIGCATSLPPNVQRPITQAWRTPQNTALGKITNSARQQSVPASYSGFKLLGGPEPAFSSRLSLIKAAEHTLDLQYYAIHADESTAYLLSELVKAARRGVRVRVLLDDFHSTGRDAQVMELGFEPNIEMRMFNPLPGSRNSALGRAYTLLTNFQRAQQRMHNKLFIADNAMAVVGGRNLGDEYFDASEDGNFIDLDALVAGPVVRDLSKSFDNYWNDERSYPAQILISAKELKDLKQLQQQRIDSEEIQKLLQQQPAPSTFADPAALNGEEAGKKNIWERASIDFAKINWTWASAVVLADRPEKIPLEESPTRTLEDSIADAAIQSPHKSNAEITTSTQRKVATSISTSNLDTDSVVDGLLTLIRGAKKELLIISPYFVPGQKIMDAIGAARSNGVQISVLTNSLASNDAPAAHAGYARHRKQLLKMGVQLYEMLSTHSGVRSVFGAGSSTGSGAGGSSRAMLHSKLLVIDSKLVVIGSMNLDMRSQYQNTEIAILIPSSPLSQEASSLVLRGMQGDAWRVQLDSQQELIWIAPQGSERSNQSTEPDASLPLRMLLRLLGPLDPDELL